MRTISGIRRNVKNHGRCSIFVDGEFFAACPIDVAVALGLKKGIEITADLERRLRSEDRRMVLRQKSYRFATYKPRTEHQVRKHLEGLEATPEEIDDVMAWLRDFRVVDDRVYIQRFVEASQERKPLSPAAVRRTLLQRGIDKHLLDDTLEGSFTEEQTIELALRVAEKKQRMMKPGTPKEVEDRIVRFLQYRGYSWTVIREVISRLSTTVIIGIVMTLSSITAHAQGILSCQRTRLPRSINAYQPTTLPVLAPDGALFVDRKQHPLNEGGAQDPDDVWISRARNGIDWTEPERESFTSVRRPDVVFNFTHDGLSALVVGRYRIQDRDTLACFAILERPSQSSVFDSVVVVEIPEVGDPGRNFFAHLSDDRNTIVLSLEGYGGPGGELDLFVTRRCGAGWSALTNLGPVINTVAIEGSPWLAEDGRTLFYSTNGRDDRKGKADLYVTRRLDDTWTSWSPPRNLGTCVNTVEDETSISLIGRGDSALITSWDAESGRAGIYQVVLDPDHRPSPYASFINEVRDARTNELITNVDVVVVDSANPETCAQVYRCDVQNGSSRMPLVQNGRYIVTTRAPGYVPHRQVIGVHQLDSTVELRVTTKLFNGRQPLTSIYFERGSYAISPEQHEKLRAAMTSYDVHQIRFEVTGYADPLGTVPKNKTLSQQRADAVRQALSTLGVDDARIVASGMGIEKRSTQPVIADEERPESRRVDIYPAP